MPPLTPSLSAQPNPSSNDISILVTEIISSNIQYLDHQINQIARPFQLSGPEDLSVKNNPILEDKMENMFFQYEIYSRKKWLLTHVKTLLTKTNALLILNMLSDNYLCEFEKEEISYILNGTSNYS